MYTVVTTISVEQLPSLAKPVTIVKDATGLLYTQVQVDGHVYRKEVITVQRAQANVDKLRANNVPQCIIDKALTHLAISAYAYSKF